MKWNGRLAVQQLEAKPLKKSFASFHSNSSFNFFGGDCGQQMETRLISFWNFGLSSDRGQINWHDDVTRSPQRNERLRTKSRKRTEKNFWIEGWSMDRFFIGKTVTVLAASNSKLTSPWLSFLSHPKKVSVNMLRCFFLRHWCKLIIMELFES